MELATRSDVLVLELTSCCPSLFNYADKQLLKTRDAGAIGRLVERKIRRLRWNMVLAVVFLLLFGAEALGVGIARSGEERLLPLVFWVVALAIYIGRNLRDRAALREAGARLVAHLTEKPEAQGRAG